MRCRIVSALGISDGLCMFERTKNRCAVVRNWIGFPALAIALMLSGGSSVRASSAEIPFTGAVNIAAESCIVQLLEAGTMFANNNKTRLESQRFGGTPGRARVISRKLDQSTGTTGRFRITFEPPTAFTSAPAGGNDNVRFRTRYSGTSELNGVNFGMRNGTRAVRLPRFGTTVTLIEGHLLTRKRSGIFPDGLYSAEVILRCE